MAAALVMALLWHGAICAGIFWLSRRTPLGSVANRARDSATHLVWMSGGGGGGGTQQKTPPRAIERAGHDARSVPTAHPAPTTVAPADLPEPRVVDHVIIPEQPLASAAEDLPGLVGAPSTAATSSQGPGRGGGAGTGNGPGSGEGTGPGRGPGTKGGFGGDDGGYEDGDDVIKPVPVYIERPRYSTDAMRARVQGVVLVECVVRPNGVCSDIHIVRSIDPRFGLDEEAAKAAGLWRFRPGTRRGQPVPVKVRIELEFSVR